MKLTHTQHAVLTAAADHPAQRVEHFPENLKGAARTKVLASLTARGLIREKGKHTVVTKAGLAAIGREQPAPAAAEGAPRRTRENTKQAAIIGTGRDIETEADRFASTLLMPLDDVRRQVEGVAPAAIARKNMSVRRMGFSEAVSVRRR